MTSNPTGAENAQAQDDAEMWKGLSPERRELLEALRQEMSDGEFIAFLKLIVTIAETSNKGGRQQAFKEAAEIARKHGDFCDSEARNGGSHLLNARATGAWHIANTIGRAAAQKED